MPTPHEVVAALPATAEANHELLRSLIVTRMPYGLTTIEDSRDFVMIDPDGAGTVLVIVQNGRLYALDPTDTTTAHDGILTLVSYDSQRYKLDDLSLPYSVLDKDLTAPPVSPAVGDTYLIYGSPTGDWAGKSGYITRYCSRGWEFVLPPIGFRVLVEDENSFYYRDPDGDWVSGLGAVTVGDRSIPITALIGAESSFVLRVENQTTNAPPGTATVGTAYIIGYSPTGAWSGNAGKIAICQVANTFLIYAPFDGDTVYDKALRLPYSWNALTPGWQTATGRMKTKRTKFNASGTFTQDPRGVEIDVTLLGGSGGAGTAGQGGGGTSIFGPYFSATGGAAAGSGQIGASGVGVGSDEDGKGMLGSFSSADNVVVPATTPSKYGALAPSGILNDGTNYGVGGPAGIGNRVILSSNVSTNVSVTIGGAGTAGTAGTAGSPGRCFIDEKVLI
jgi:hypothetical protein